MRQLNKTQSIIFLIGGVFMVIGAGCCSFMWHQAIFSILFLLGALLFSTMQCMETYEGNNFVIKRLKRIMTIADLLFVLSGIVMVETANRFLLNTFLQYEGGAYVNYFTYIYNKWVVLLLVASILEVYTVHRISSELKKESGDNAEEKS